MDLKLTSFVGGGAVFLLDCRSGVEALGVAAGPIISRLASVHATPIEIGAYFAPDKAKTDTAMCPSSAFNAINGSIGG